ncbi:MAG: TonB-dependent receptor [Acidobacteriota bacterium]|nr:TonB-dependent receptor [Acidobacteriota bacterium]
MRSGKGRRAAPDSLAAHVPLALCAWLALGLLAPESAAGRAQSQLATVSGTVFDEKGAVVAGAVVTAFNPLTGLERRTATDGEGCFTIPLLPADSYSILVQRAGFKTVDLRHVVLGAGEQALLRVRLTVGPINEHITVRAGAADGSVTVSHATSASTSFGPDVIENLPLSGRTLQSLIGLAPGTVLTATNFNEQGQFSVNGQRPNANYFVVDGVSANFGVSAGPAPGQAAAGSLPALSSFGGTNNLVSADAVQEVRVQALTYEAELGRAPGAHVTFTTRSGTNEWRGSAFASFRHGALDANDWFVNARGLPKPPAEHKGFGGVFGGPVVKDRTFFFVSYEGLRSLQPRVAVTAVPSDTTRLLASPAVRPLVNAFPRPSAAGRELRFGAAEFAAAYGEPSRLDALSARADHIASDRLLLFGRYAQAPSRTAQRGSQNPPTSTARLTLGFGRPLAQSLSTVSESSFETRTLTLGATFTPAPRVALDSRFNWSRARGATFHRLDEFGGAAPPPQSYLFPAHASPADGLIQLLVLMPLDQAANLRVGKDADNVNRQLNAVNTLGLVRGPHHFKFGVDYRRLAPVFDAPAYTQTLAFTSFGLDPLDPETVLSATTWNAQIYSEDDPRRPLFHNLSVFAQDGWHVSPNLTVSYGLRWELSPPPRETTGRHPAVLKSAARLRSSVTPHDLELTTGGAPLWKTSYTDFAPRVGAAYHLRRTGTTLRAGFGVFFDSGNGQAAQAFGSVPPYTLGRRAGRVRFPLSPADAAPPAPVSAPTAGTFYAFDPDLETPYKRQWSATVAQQLGTAQVLTASYVGAQGRRLLRGEVFLRPFSPTGFFGESTVVLMENAAESDYHGLLAQFERSLSEGLAAYASYTWSHSIDDASDDSTLHLHEARPVPDRGPSNFDIRHSLSVAVSYDLPAAPLGKLGRALSRGWSLDTVARWRTATPVNLTMFTHIYGGAVVQSVRPDLIEGAPVYVTDSRLPGGRALNPEAFALPGDGGRGDGSLGRNALRGFGASQVDAALRRKFALTEGLAVQLRAEVYNVFNHPNFAGPSPGFEATQTLGQSLGSGGPLGGLLPMYQFGGPRSIQFTTKLQF